MNAKASPAALQPELSLYLDAVRFTAALTVFLAHFALHRLSGGLLWQLNPYGHEAVTVFFVLSGYVIAYATDTREKTARDYAISRLARLYSVALPAVLLTLVLDGLGSWLRPQAYGATWGYVSGLNPVAILSDLSFTNELWTRSVPLGSNAAYWSMGYEVPYYLVFGLAHFVRGPARWPLVAAAVVLAGPSIAASLPLWLMGVGLYRLGRRSVCTPAQGVALFVLSLLAWVAYEVQAWHGSRLLIEATPWFKRREVLQDYIVGGCFGANLLGFQAAAPLLGAPLLRVAGATRWLAGSTFTLYLCHLPVAQLLVALSPWPVDDARCRGLVLGGTLTAVLVLAAHTERRKAAWRRLFEALDKALRGTGRRARRPPSPPPPASPRSTGQTAPPP